MAEWPPRFPNFAVIKTLLNKGSPPIGLTDGVIPAKAGI